MQTESRRHIAVAIEITGAAIVWAIFLFFALQRAPILTAFAVLALTIVAFFFILGPVYAFCFYFATTFFLTIPLQEFPVSGNQIVGFLFIIAWLHWFLRRKTSLPRGRFFLFLTCIVIYFSISALTGEDFNAGAQHCYYLVLYFVLAMLISSLIRDDRSLKKILWIMLIATGLSSLIGLAEFVLQTDLIIKAPAYWHGYLRINGTAPNSIVFAYNSVYAFPLGYYLFSESRTQRLRFAAIALALLINAVDLLTFNRQTMIFIAVQFLVMPFLFKNRYNRVFLTGLTLVILLTAPIALPTVASRLGRLFEKTRDRSVAMRHDTFLVGLEILKSKPLLGIGLGSFATRWQKYLPSTTYNLQFDKEGKHYPDFGYNQMMSETGIIGLAIMLIFFFTIVRMAWKIRRKSLREDDHARANFASIILGMMSTFLLANFIQDTFLYIRTWIMYALMLALTRGDFKSNTMEREIRN
jgi:O-antigen ligase